MKVTKKIELAIKAVTALKGINEPVRTVDLAVSIGTTTNFLEQIMRNLRRAGIVKSTRGPGGGYLLASDTRVSAYLVARAVGRDFTYVTSDAPTDRLNQALAEAFLNTTI